MNSYGRILLVAGALCSCTLLSACEKTPAPDAGKPAAVSSPAATPSIKVAAVASAPELTDDDLAVPEDYLEEATKELDSKNYKAQLDALEKDIDTPDN